MKIIKLKFKIIIGVVLFILIVGGAYCSTIFNLNKSKTNYKQIGNIEYKGTLLMPIENFEVVTSKYGGRIHPITREI